MWCSVLRIRHCHAPARVTALVQVPFLGQELPHARGSAKKNAGESKLLIVGQPRLYLKQMTGFQGTNLNEACTLVNSYTKVIVQGLVMFYCDYGLRGNWVKKVQGTLSVLS